MSEKLKNILAALVTDLNVFLLAPSRMQNWFSISGWLFHTRENEITSSVECIGIVARSHWAVLSVCIVLLVHKNSHLSQNLFYLLFRRHTMMDPIC